MIMQVNMRRTRILNNFKNEYNYTNQFVYELCTCILGAHRASQATMFVHVDCTCIIGECPNDPVSQCRECPVQPFLYTLAVRMLLESVPVSQCRECPMFSQASPLWTHRGSIGYTSRSHIDDNDKYDDGGTEDDDDGGTEDDDDDDDEKLSIWGDCKAVSRAQAGKGIRPHSQLVSSQSDN